MSTHDEQRIRFLTIMATRFAIAFMVIGFVCWFFAILMSSNKLGDMGTLFFVPGLLAAVGVGFSRIDATPLVPAEPRIPKAERKRIARELATARADQILADSLRDLERERYR